MIVTNKNETHLPDLPCCHIRRSRRLEEVHPPVRLVLLLLLGLSALPGLAQVRPAVRSLLRRRVRDRL